METPYSMKDILRYRKAAYLSARVSREEGLETLERLATDSKPLSFTFNSIDWQGLAKHFKPFLPGLSQRAMKGIYEQFARERRETWERRIENEPESGVERIFPLGAGAYDHFAQYVWEKRGKPQFASYLTILNCKWGEPKTETKRTGENEMTVTIYVGCEIKTNMRGKRFLKLISGGIQK